MTYNNWVYIAVMAAVSYAIRVLPLTLIRKPIQNRFIQSFLFYVPYVTLAVMTFPAIVNATQSPLAGAAALGGGIAAAWVGAQPVPGVGRLLRRGVCSGIVFGTVMKMQKILVSGAGGFVGARVMQQWREKADLLAFPRGFLAVATQEDLCRFAAQGQPDVVLHLAALSDTGYCQQHPEDSRRANVDVPLWMARAASETGAKLVAFSSDQVYSGAAQEGPLPETLSLSPSNIYGQHKLEAEQRVLEVLPDAVFLRVPWMYDLPGYQLPIRGNLPLNLLRAALRGTPVQFSAHDWRGISFVREVIGNLNPALSLPGGVYNFGSDNDRSMVETARQFAELLGISVAIEITNWHRNLRMDGCKAAAQGITFCSTQEGFARCLKEYNLSGGPR